VKEVLHAPDTAHKKAAHADDTLAGRFSAFGVFVMSDWKEFLS
jgi:hypothetical protein